MSGNYYDFVKRAIDLVVASLGLLLTLPIQALLAVLVKVKLGSPVLFRQTRPGRHEVVFEVLKFRTMVEPDRGIGLVTDADRITPLGSFLRSTSLDELPTLWNVVKGDMSLVGPRPLLVHYVNLYSPEQRRRHDVRPGVTGLAQVHGRNAVEWDARLAKDIEYVDNRSLLLDLRIIGRTVVLVLARKGIHATGNVSMPEFLGSPRG